MNNKMNNKNEGKLKNKFILLIGVVFIIAVVFFGASRCERGKARGEWASEVFGLGSGVSPTTIEEIKAAIAANEKQIERYVETASKTGLYWKLLASRLQDRSLHGEALEALWQAIYYTPEDPVLHYSMGISAGILAKSIHILPGGDRNERERYYDLAEESFLRAIELDGRYFGPRYSLGVLYAFDLDRPEDAIPQLERCLEISRNDVDTMFVLARSYFMVRRFQDAVDLYDRIITLSGDEQKRIDAQNNRQMVLGQANG